MHILKKAHVRFRGTWEPRELCSLSQFKAMSKGIFLTLGIVLWFPSSKYHHNACLYCSNSCMVIEYMKCSCLSLVKGSLDSLKPECVILVTSWLAQNHETWYWINLWNPFSCYTWQNIQNINESINTSGKNEWIFVIKTMWLTFLKITQSPCWRDGSAVKHAYWSSQRPEFCPQNLTVTCAHL